MLDMRLPETMTALVVLAVLFALIGGYLIGLYDGRNE